MADNLVARLRNYRGRAQELTEEAAVAITDLMLANGLLQNQVKDLRGDLNIERLHRDAKLCSQCPRAPEFERLQLENAELRHSLAMNWPYSGA